MGSGKIFLKRYRYVHAIGDASNIRKGIQLEIIILD